MAKKVKAAHPDQPIVVVDGIARFKHNAIIKWIIESNRTNMNELAVLNFTNADRAQFAQLIGYSVSGFGDLSYAPRDKVAHFDRIVARIALPQRRKKAGRKG